MKAANIHSNRQFLLGAAVIVVILALVYLLFGLKDLVGQAGEMLQPAACEQGKFYLASAGALERCNCVSAGGVNSCARGSCDGAVCRTMKHIIIDPQGGKATVNGVESTSLDLAVGTPLTISTSPPASAAGTEISFLRWEDETGTTMTPPSTVTKDITLRARWEIKHRLTLQITPDATGTVTDQKGVVLQAQQLYPASTSLTLTATPSANFQFAGWSGDIPATCTSKTLSCPITMDAPKTVTAAFAQCGNGIVEAGEACDDKNVNAGDGCSSTCTVEAGYTCTGAPSVCRSSTFVTSFNLKYYPALACDVGYTEQGRYTSGSYSWRFCVQKGSVKEGSTIKYTDLVLSATASQIEYPELFNNLCVRDPLADRGYYPAGGADTWLQKCGTTCDVVMKICFKNDPTTSRAVVDVKISNDNQGCEQDYVDKGTLPDLSQHLCVKLG